MNHTAGQIKDFFESFRTREGQKGFVTALLIVITILTAYSWIWSIQFQTAQNDSWVSASRNPVLYFPSYNDAQYFFYVTAIGEHAGSVNVTVQQANGWLYSGTFLLHDIVSFGNWKVQIEEINLDRTNPIHLQYITYSDGRPLLTIIFVILLIAAFTSWGTKSKRKAKSNQDRPKE